MKKIIELFTIFFKIGAFTFGGGYAMLSLIQREIADKKEWITQEDILNMTAISESTPGPIAVNMATFVGFKVAGFWGAFFATLGVVLPSFIIISLISTVLRSVQDNIWVEKAFEGIRIGVLALIAKSLVSLYKQCPKGKLSYFVMGMAFVLVAVFHVHVLLTIIICALTGLFYTYVLSKSQVKAKIQNSEEKEGESDDLH